MPVLKPPFDKLRAGATRIAKGPGGSELVPAKMTYYEWLKTQPKSFQDDAIWPTRAKLLRDGSLSAEKFARLSLGNDFEPLTLAEMRAKEPGLFDEAIGEGRLVARRASGAASGAVDENKNTLQSGAESSILKSVDKINTISSPIEQGARGRPSAITSMGGVGLSARQQLLLDKLPVYDSRAIVPKNDVSMTDLSALTATTDAEYAMFTKGRERLIIRGNAKRVNITRDDAEKLNAEGYKWSGHTHVGLYGGWELSASNGDYDVLSTFSQKESVIYNVKGEYRTFENLLR